MTIYFTVPPLYTDALHPHPSLHSDRAGVGTEGGVTMLVGTCATEVEGGRWAFVMFVNFHP